MSKFTAAELVTFYQMIGSLIIALIMGVSWGYITGIDAMQDQLQTQAIERGYALYCPTDLSVQHKGKFAWNGECDK